MPNMNSTPTSSRAHIAIFGRRNAGKSSIMNRLANQRTSVVSDTPGTTTDPVFRAMELLPVGPIVLVDTAGLDDEGSLGSMRVARSLDVLNRAAAAVLVVDASVGVTAVEEDIVRRIRDRSIPIVGVANKIDLPGYTLDERRDWEERLGLPLVEVSAVDGTGFGALKAGVIAALAKEEGDMSLVGDLVRPGDMVVMVVPIDKAAPKGRLILPQQQAIRDTLEADAMAIVTKEYELRATLESLSRKPALVITDSQAFMKVSADTPRDVLLTSFSILLARQKGDLGALVRGALAVDSLRPGDAVLVAEGCTHHRQSDDIGTVKIPRWLRQAAGGDLRFEWTSGHGFPEDLSPYRLVVHCGACMLGRREMCHRIAVATEQQVPIVNYGVLLAYVQGILPRVLEPFPAAMMALTGETPCNICHN